MIKIFLKIFFVIILANSFFLTSSSAIGSTPVETCIDKFLENGNSYDYGAEVCNKFTKDSVKCMDFIVEKGMDLTNSALLCNGGGNGSYKCMTSLVNKFGYISAAHKCFGTTHLLKN